MNNIMAKLELLSELTICNQELRAELDKLSEQRQKLIEKIDEDILDDGYMRGEPYFLGRVEEAQSIKDFIGG